METTPCRAAGLASTWRASAPRLRAWPQPRRTSPWPPAVDTDIQQLWKRAPLRSCMRTGAARRARSRGAVFVQVRTRGPGACLPWSSSASRPTWRPRGMRAWMTLVGWRSRRLRSTEVGPSGTIWAAGALAVRGTLGCRSAACFLRIGSHCSRQLPGHRVSFTAAPCGAGARGVAQHSRVG